MYADTAASSGNRMFLIIVFFTFVFAFKREGLDIFPSVRVHFIPSSAVLKACLGSSDKKIAKNVSASTQSCWTALTILIGLDIFLSCCTVPHIFLLKDLMRPLNFDEHLILVRSLNKPSLFTRSKTFLRSMN